MTRLGWSADSERGAARSQVGGIRAALLVLLAIACFLAAGPMAEWLSSATGDVAAIRVAAAEVPGHTETWLICQRGPWTRRLLAWRLADLHLHLVEGLGNLPTDVTERARWGSDGEAPTDGRAPVAVIRLGYGCAGWTEQTCSVAVWTRGVDWSRALNLELSVRGWEVTGDADRFCD